MGDFNYGQIDWDKGVVPDPDDSDDKIFYEKTQDLLLYQHVDVPTRFRDGCTPSMLNLIFSTEELMVNNLEVRSPLGKSDHAVLIWDFICKNGSFAHLLIAPHLSLLAGRAPELPRSFLARIAKSR